MSENIQNNATLSSKEGKKASRTVRLTQDLNNRLVALCTHLGTNPNSYLVSEIGKCISRDEIAFSVKKTHDQASEFFNKMQKELDNDIFDNSGKPDTKD